MTYEIIKTDNRTITTQKFETIEGAVSKMINTLVDLHGWAVVDAAKVAKLDSYVLPTEGSNKSIVIRRAY